jgi:hypothetical protein
MKSPTDRREEIIDRDPAETRLTDKQVDEFIWLVYEAHNGDDYCCCLRIASGFLIDPGDRLMALEIMRNCIAEHDSGSDLRKWEAKELAKDLKTLR